MLSKTVLDMAHRIEQSLARSYAEYLEACEADRADGYRPHYCEHGTSQWTDYDNICGPCEDGVTMGDGLFRRQFAIDAAKHKDRAIKDMVTAASELSKHLPDFVWAPVWKRMSEILDSCDRY